MDTEPPVQAALNLEHQITEVRGELLAFLRRRVPNDYEEIAQDTWLRIARANPSCPDERSFRAYTFAVARRLIIDHYRRRQVRPQLVALDTTIPIPGNDDPHSELCASEVITVVSNELALMKPEIAEVFRLRTNDNLSFQQIADRQNVSINTALGRMHNAIKKLNAGLTKAGWVEGDDK
jgi:RNA polymerase sigma factor (sigma-70 family)